MGTVKLRAQTGGCAAEAPVEAPEPEVADPEEAPVEETPAFSSRTVMAADILWDPANPDAPEGVKVHILSGNPKEGAFTAVVQFPPGFNMGLHTHESNFMGVTLSEGAAHWSTADEPEALPMGSAWFQPGGPQRCLRERGAV